MITGNEPAMPSEASHNDDGITEMQTGNTTCMYYGLTIRQHFAAMAMQGLLSVPTKSDDVNAYLSACAEASVIAADALIAELNKPKP